MRWGPSGIMLSPMASKKTAAKAKKASGRNISEDERGTKAVKLRLDPEAREVLAALAKKSGMTMSDVVMIALEVLRNDDSLLK